MKHLLIILLALPMVLVGCSSKSQWQSNAENHIHDWLDKMAVPDGKLEIKSYSNIKKIYSSKADSILIYSIDIVTNNGNTDVAMPIEFYYLVLPENGGEIAGINLLCETGSILKVADEMVDVIPKEQQKDDTREQMVNLCVYGAFQSDRIIKHSVK